MAASTYERLPGRPGLNPPIGAAAAASGSSIAAGPLMSVGSSLTVLLIVLVVGRVPEMTAMVLGTSFYQVLLVDVILLALAAISGTMLRVGSNRICAIWIAFHLWILFTIPFSGYKRGSVENLQNVVVFVPLIIAVGGFLTTDLNSLRKGLWALAWAGLIGLVYIYSGNVQDSEDRLQSSGMFGNSNALAVYLLTVLPVWAFIAGNKASAMFFRLLFSVAILMALLSIIRTGSRSGFLTLLILALISFVTASAANKAKLVVLYIVGGLVISTVMSGALKTRIGTLVDSGADDSVAREAVSSSEERKKLLEDSLKATVRHPLVGTGFGVSSVVIATEKIAKGERTSWQVSHNMYTQISSELGLPGFFLYVTGVIWSLQALFKARKAVHYHPELAEIGAISGALLAAWVVCLFNGFFTSMALEFWLYLLSGFSIAVVTTTENLLRQKALASGGSGFAEPQRSTRFFPSAKPALTLAPAAGISPPVPTPPADKNADAPWRRNPRKYPPSLGTPSR